MSENKVDKSKNSKGSLDATEISMFCTQIALVLKAGIPLYDGISDVYEDLEEEKVKQAMEIVNKELCENKSLKLSIEKSNAFPEYVVNMVGIGEMSGKLEEVMLALADYYIREKRTKERIKNAVIYPIMLFIMLSAVVVLLMTKILPVFQDIFKQLGGEVSIAAVRMMDFGVVAGGAALFFIAAVIIITVILMISSKTEKGALFGQKFIVSFPFTKKVASKVLAHRFASAMELMLSSGVNTDEALDMTKGIIQNKYIENKIDECNEMVRKGQSLTEAIRALKIFPSLFTRMLEVGFKTGSVSDVMKKLTEIYEEEIDNSLNNMTSMIEPCLVGILAIIIGAILISVMLPLVGVMSSIG